MIKKDFVPVVTLARTESSIPYRPRPRHLRNEVIYEIPETEIDEYELPEVDSNVSQPKVTTKNVAPKADSNVSQPKVTTKNAAPKVTKSTN